MSATSDENKEPESTVTFPLCLIENFFRYVHLHEAKEMLNEVQEQLLERSYPHLPGSIPYDNTIYFFEKLEALLNAAYLLNPRQ